jgi:hypothetical protein
MKTFAFLSSWWTTFNSLTIVNVSNDNSHLIITLADSDQPHLVTIDDLPSYFVKAQDVRQAQTTIITSKKPPKLDFLTAVAQLYLQQKVSALIKNSSFTKGEVTFFLKGKLTRLTKEQLSSLNYTNLVAAEALADGYELTEEPGSHWIITSPLGYQTVTKLHTCSCTEFSQTKDCTHLRLATAFHEKRYLLNLCS